jgi:hypothetical protein
MSAGRSRSSGIGSLLSPPRLARRIGRCFVRPCASSAYSQSSERARGYRATTLSTMILDLTDEETATLARLLMETIDGDRYPLSPRILTLKAILAKIRPEPVRKPSRRCSITSRRERRQQGDGVACEIRARPTSYAGQHRRGSPHADRVVQGMPAPSRTLSSRDGRTLRRRDRCLTGAIGWCARSAASAKWTW